jgi:hypothetical protein
MCGEVLVRRSPVEVAASLAGCAAPSTGVRLVPRDGAERSAWAFLAVGLALAPVLTFTPLLRYVGWFLASLTHETGHAAISWALGCPAVPAIRLDGHAAAVHREQQVLLCALAMGGLAALAWQARRDRARLALFAALVAVYPVLAFTEAREALFLAGGHLGELAFAGVFLAMAARGGVTGGPAERACHATVGWYLVGRNVWLAGGLAWSESARSAYGENGSFGLENDFVRLSRDVFGVPLPTVGVALLVVAVAAAGGAIGLGLRRARSG